jgi:hypothetical protein
MIPKIAHFYWDGAGPMSFMRYMTLVSFVRHNPDWHICLYVGDGTGKPEWFTEEVQDITSYSGPDYLSKVLDLPIEVLRIFTPPEEAMSPVHFKDLLNWQLLAAGGGVVADMDIFWIKSLDELGLRGDACFVEFQGNPKVGYIPVTFIASAGNSALFEDVFGSALDRYDPKRYESCGTPALPGSLDQMRNMYPYLEIVRLDDSCVFPFHHLPYVRAVNATHGIGGRTEAFSPSSVGIHWYAGNPISQKMNNYINEDTVETMDSPLLKAVRECLNHSSL